MLEDKILSLSTDQRVNLPAIIKRAEEQNFPGVTFTSKPAWFFIKDCVDIAEDYVYLAIYNLIEGPMTKLKGKVTKVEVKEFVYKTSPAADALLNLMLIDIYKMGINISAEPVTEEAPAPVIPASNDDVYGVYGNIDSVADIVVVEKEPAPIEIKHDISNADAVIATLCEVLEAT